LAEVTVATDLDATAGHRSGGFRRGITSLAVKKWTCRLVRNGWSVDGVDL